MESVIVVTPGEYDANFKSRLELIGPVDVMEGGGLVLDDGLSRIYITRNNNATAELEPERLAHIRAMIQIPIFYSVDFTDVALCRRVIEAIADDPNLVVDNDRGVVLPGSRFVELLRSRQDWDWRLDQS